MIASPSQASKQQAREWCCNPELMDLSGLRSAGSGVTSHDYINVFVIEQTKKYAAFGTRIHTSPTEINDVCKKIGGHVRIT